MTNLLCGEMKFKNRRELTYGLLILCLGFIGGFLWGRQQSLTVLPEAAAAEAGGLESKPIPTRGNKSPIEAIENATIQRAHESETHKNAPKQSSELVVGDIETIGNDYVLKRQEENFQTTIRSCLGSECFDQKVKLYSGKEVARIGILALEHSGGQPLFDFLQRLHGGKELAKFDLVYENHAPAYGYGKNHGWSSIIRLARRPIPHSYSLARAVSSEVSVSLLSTQVRQTVRWHCRLSHVAAHTRMLTVFVEDILSRPIVEMEKIITYIGIKLDRPKMVAAIDEFRAHVTRDLGARAPNDLPGTLLEGAVAALEDELTSTKGLTQWPCKMFRDLEPEKSGVRLLMPASQVAANCTGLYVTCSVPYDQRGG